MFVKHIVVSFNILLYMNNFILQSGTMELDEP